MNSWVKKIGLIAGLLVGSAFGQNVFPALVDFPGTPTGGCQKDFLAINDATGALYTCLNGSWSLITGTATGAILSAPGTAQSVVQPATGGATPGSSLNVNSLENVNYGEDFTFNQSPTNPTTISVGSNTVTINAVRGINAFSATPGISGFFTKHYLYLAGTGTAEPVLITGTNCTGSSTGTCTVTFTTVNTHSAGYTLGSATGGFQEAYNDALLNTHDLAPGSQLSGMTVLGRPTDFPVFNAQLSIDSTAGTVGPIIFDFRGTTITCNTSGGDCIRVGTHVGAEGTIAPNDVTIMNFQIIPSSTFVRTANGTSIAIHDAGQNTNIIFGSFGANGTAAFDNLIVLDGDQNYDVGWIKMNIGNGPPMKCDSTWCGSEILATPTNSAANGRIHNSDLTAQCHGNLIDIESGNGVELDNLILQNWNQWAWKYGGGLVDANVVGHLYYETGVGCTNPDFGVGGYSAGIVYAGNHQLTLPSDPGFAPSVSHFSNTGTNIRMYYVVGNKAGQQTNPLYIGYASTNGSTQYSVLYKPFNATTYDVLMVPGGANDGTDHAPYGTGNYLVSGGNVCSSSPCSFTETFAAATSYTVNPAYVPAITDFNYWPVPVFMSGSGSGGPLYAGPCFGVVNTSLFSFNNYYNAIFTGVGSSGGNNCGANSTAQTGLIALQLNPNVNGSAGGTATTGALILNPEQTNAVLTQKKGRINFPTIWNMSSSNTCLITLFDNNPVKTLRTWGHQPGWDSGDTCWGFDTSPSTPAFMSSGAQSFYVNHLFDGSNWVFQISATGITVKTPGTALVIPQATTVGALPNAATNSGAWTVVNDSTTISAEGQTCVGSSTNVAMAFSNGSAWKCF